MKFLSWKMLDWVAGEKWSVFTGMIHFPDLKFTMSNPDKTTLSSELKCRRAISWSSWHWISSLLISHLGRFLSQLCCHQGIWRRIQEDGDAFRYRYRYLKYVWCLQGNHGSETNVAVQIHRSFIALLQCRSCLQSTESAPCHNNQRAAVFLTRWLHPPHLKLWHS